MMTNKKIYNKIAIATLFLGLTAFGCSKSDDVDSKMSEAKEKMENTMDEVENTTEDAMASAQNKADQLGDNIEEGIDKAEMEAQQMGNDIESMISIDNFDGAVPLNYDKIASNMEYPEEAQNAGVEGEVMVRIYINKNGLVDSTKVVEGIGSGCDEVAMNNAAKLKFKPALDNGLPTSSIVVLPVDFRL